MEYSSGRGHKTIVVIRLLVVATASTGTVTRDIVLRIGIMMSRLDVSRLGLNLREGL